MRTLDDVGTPEVSVVIAASRMVRLSFALEALAKQTLDAERFEVIVVRDGDWPLPAARPEFDLYLLKGLGNANIATLRNLGWRSARGRIVAFTDDDCRPRPDWLERMLEGSGDSKTVLQGRTEPDADEVHLLHGLARTQQIVGPSPWYESCNIAYPRNLLERLGGFDERFAAIGEDADLALRACAAGAEVRYLDDAVVSHAVLPRTLATALREARRRDTIPLLISRHPGQRRVLYGRLFWRRSHAALLLAIFGVFAAHRRPVAAIAVLPYVRTNTDPRVLRGGASRLAHHGFHLLARTTVDLTEIATTLAAAARTRTLVV